MQAQQNPCNHKKQLFERSIVCKKKPNEHNKEKLKVCKNCSEQVDNGMCLLCLQESDIPLIMVETQYKYSMKAKDNCVYYFCCATQRSNFSKDNKDLKKFVLPVLEFDLTSKVQEKMNIFKGQCSESNKIQVIDLPYNFENSQSSNDTQLLTGGFKFVDQKTIQIVSDCIELKLSHQLGIWNLTFEPLSKMSSERVGHSSFYLNSKLYIFGGINNQKQYLKSCEVYDIKAKQWKSLADMNRPRARAGVHGTENGFIYLIGGFLEYGNQQINQSIDRYSTSNNSWVSYKVQQILTASPIIFPMNSNTFLIIGGGNGYDLYNICYQVSDEHQDHLDKKMKLKVTAKEGLEFPLKNNGVQFQKKNDSEFEMYCFGSQEQQYLILFNIKLDKQQSNLEKITLEKKYKQYFEDQPISYVNEFYLSKIMNL